MIDSYALRKTTLCSQTLFDRIYVNRFRFSSFSLFFFFFHMEGNGSGYGRKLRNARIRSIFLSSFFLPPRLWNFMTFEDVQAFTTLRRIIAWSLMGQPVNRVFL